MKNNSLYSRIHSMIKKTVIFITQPININLVLFILLYLFLFVLDILYTQDKKTSLLIAICGIFISYILILPSLLPKIKKIYTNILLTISSFIFLIQLLCILFYKKKVDGEIIGTFKATNLSEIYEYLTVYVHFETILMVIALFVIIFVLYKLLKDRHLFTNTSTRMVGAFIILFSFIFTIININNIVSYSSIRKIVWLFTKQVPDLRDYLQKPSVNINNEYVDNIVLIIGESYSKYQCSLYGYEKNTTPLLTKIHNNGNLKVFKNIQSYTNLTIPSIKSIMTSYINEYSDSIDWYKYLTLIEIMKTAGYKTAWISNQSKKGISDNEVGRYADLCDNQLFVGNIYAGLNRKNLDEELIPLVKNYCSTNLTDKNKNFIIIHLMGSHHSFNHRYPKRFSRFSAKDYEDTHSHLSINNRQLLAEYDNSVLYNDSIVYELINNFTDKETIVFYFPDHGIDPFRSSSNYIGHAEANNPASIMHGKQIPFFVYTTDKYKKRFPLMEEIISNAIDIHYRTDSIMYTIIDIAGIETINGISYKNKSLFK